MMIDFFCREFGPYRRCEEQNPYFRLAGKNVDPKNHHVRSSGFLEQEQLQKGYSYK